MKPSSRAIATGIATTALIGSAAVAPAATAAPSPDSASPQQAQSIAEDLGASRTAGTYIDAKTNASVVTVTDDKAAAEVERAGATAKVVEYSAKQLNSVKSELDETGLVTGASWAVDPVTNRVTVTTDDSVKGAKLAKVRKAVEKFGGKVTMRKTAGTYSTKITGGDAIYAEGSGRCSLGFNVTTGDGAAFLTAGHCTELASPTWYEDEGQSTLLGTGEGSFPGDDYAIVHYDAGYTDHPSQVGDNPIDSAGTPTVGEAVTRSGSTTGTHEGEVTALDASVQYAEGTVEGLIQTTVCAEPGDSGGSLYAGSTAYGLTSGGSGDCTSGGETFFQPVEEALEVYGAEIGG